MSGRRIAAIALAGALVVGGGGAAVAAVTKDDERKAEQAILDDAAKRLNVTPQALRDALAAARDAQLDQAVKDGLLTQKQADAIKARGKQSGRVLGGPALGKRPGGPHGLFFGPGGGPLDMLDDIAKALGITTAKLDEQLRDGKSLADIAKAEGKSLSDVKSALKAAVKTRLDKAVADEDLTRAQADELLEHLDDTLDAIATGRLGAFGKGLRGHAPRGLFGGPGRGGGPREMLADIAKALGVTTSQLMQRLADGKSLADIAKAEGTSLSSVKAAVKSTAKTRLDKAVADGDITRAQADEMLEHLDRHLDAIARGRLMLRGHRGKPPLGAPPPDMRPGGFAPDEAPALVAPDGMFS